MKITEYIKEYFINNKIPLKLSNGFSTVEVSILGSKTGCNKPIILRFNKKYFPERPTRMSLALYITTLNNKQYCRECEEVLPYIEFYKNKANKTGLQYICKNCQSKKDKQHYKLNREKIKQRTRVYDKEIYKPNNRQYLAYKESIRRTTKLQRTPSWANLNKIKEFYLNCPDGYHVDHIIPLQGKNISGLHVENNLQYLMAKENLSKGNKWPYYPDK